MGHLHTRAVRVAPHMMLFVGIHCAALAVFLSSCSPGLPVQRDAYRPGEEGIQARYTFVFVIHGDGAYLYHDTSGVERRADEEALANAIRLAERNPRAEVIIFHQRPRRHTLFFFPDRDGEAYHYREGKLIARETYWRAKAEPGLAAETELYRRMHMSGRNERLGVFLYFGHEIPESGGTGYDASVPERGFTVRDLALGLEGLVSHSSQFDLIVLSTCFGGTPYTVDAISPYARQLIASPENLHLSYLDVRSLEDPGAGSQEENAAAFAKRFARHAFDRLTGEVQTAVSVVVYDVERVQGYVRSVRGEYERDLASMNRRRNASEGGVERCDCAELPGYMLPSASEGVEVLYRPARFGRSKDKQYHSGWQCVSERQERGAAAPTAASVSQ